MYFKYSVGNYEQQKVKKSIFPKQGIRCVTDTIEAKVYQLPNKIHKQSKICLGKPKSCDPLMKKSKIKSQNIGLIKMDEWVNTELSLLYTWKGMMEP